MAEKFIAEPFKSLFEMEESVLGYWQADQTFKKSLAKNESKETYSFYDGPPFITGLPHYATLLPSIAKDIVPRFQTMKGKLVRRQWGWDVHGLPAETQVEKRLGLKGKKDIEELGVDKFIAECRAYVNEVSDAWGWYVDHIGRWTDLASAYRTDDLAYMESVMRAFKQLHDKGLIYRGKRVSLYCPRCATPLSKFEITMDDENYRDVEDPAVTIGFQLVDEDALVLAWTTTPWTLPANAALAVNPTAEYVKVTDGRRHYILAHEALERYPDLEIVEYYKGEALVGKRYQPLYQFFPTQAADFQIHQADFVTMTDGTGVVHIAPGFGEDDTKLGEEQGLSLFETVDAEGHFVAAVTPWAGQFYKKANPAICSDLRERGLLFKEETITHSYPHCYRCGTPLIYKAQVAWYLSIEPLRARLLAGNRSIRWQPKHFGDGRFTYNLETAPDWSISRSRYWGSPLPVWETDDGELFVPGSIAELEQASGQKITDLHRPAIDEVVVTTPSGKPAHRVKDVLDCWFESGSMPYAQDHYPFEHQAEFERHFPADFIIEYTGQLRGWFYYLHVLANALFEQNAFKNVAVTGVLMGTDGRKMSKSYGNYPDPKATIEKYGAESLRLYFMGSKIMNGEDLAINEDEIRDESRLLGVLHNAVRYWLTYATAHGWSLDQPPQPVEKVTTLDTWMRVRTAELIATIDQNLDQLHFQAAILAIRPFVEDLSTWYIRRSRDRFVAGDPAALATLQEVLRDFALAVAPILPFTAEYIWGALGGSESVHLQDYPKANQVFAEENQELTRQMTLLRQLASAGQMLRAEAGQSLRQPLTRLVLIGFDELQEQSELVAVLADELNVSRVEFAKPSDGQLAWTDVGTGSVGLDLELTDELKAEGRFRELTRQLQDARKKAGLQVGEKVGLSYQTDDPELAQLFSDRQADLLQAVGLTSLQSAEQITDGLEVPGEKLWLKFDRS